VKPLRSAFGAPLRELLARRVELLGAHLAVDPARLSPPPGRQPSATARDDEIVLIRETPAVLTSMLHDAGVRPGRVGAADVLTAVEVFRRFAAVAVDDAASPEQDGDGVLAEYGTFTFDGVREFRADLTRQVIEADDEDAMWQLHCTFHWSPGADTEALGSGTLWSFGMPLDEFFAAARALPGWAWALAGAPAPRRLTIELDEV